MANLAIRVSAGHFSYGDDKILNEINLNVRKGSIYALLGPSGCGKTTLLDILIGMKRLQSGTVEIFGYKPGSPESGTPGPGVGYMPQEAALEFLLTSDETFNYFGRIFNINQEKLKAQKEFLIGLLNLPDQNELIKNLSGGEQRRVSLAVSLVHMPRLLLLDEPTVGVDPLLRNKVWWELRNISQKENITIVITTHYIEEARLADATGFLNYGKILLEDNPISIIQRFQVNSLEKVFFILCDKQMHIYKEDKRQNNCYSISQTDSSKQSITINNGDDINFSYNENNNNDNNNNSNVHNNNFKSGEPFQLKKNLKTQLQIILALLIKYFILTRRNPMFLYVLIITSNLIILLIWNTFGLPPTNISTGLVIETQNIASDSSDSIEFTEDLSAIFLTTINEQTFSLNKYENFSFAIDQVRNGVNTALIYLNENFSRSFIIRDFYLQNNFNDDLDDMWIDNQTIHDGSIFLYGDYSKYVLMRHSRFALTNSLENFRNLLSKKFSLNYHPLVKIEPIAGEFSINDPLGFREFIIIGFIITTTFANAFFLSGQSLVSQIASNWYKRNFSASIKNYEMAIALIIVNFLFQLFSTIINLLFCKYIIKIAFQGSMLDLIWLFSELTFFGQICGVIFAMYAKNLAISAMVSAGMIFIASILSGFMWPVSAFPYYVRWLALRLPFTLSIKNFHDLIYKDNVSFTEMNILYLAWISVFLIIALLSMRKI